MNLNFLSGLENDAKKLASDAWSGAKECDANAACKATVEKYGVEAGKAFMKREALQELSFGSFFHHVEDDAKKAVNAVEPIAKYAAGKAWKGTKACYASASCKASVEKIGLAATEAAFALQQQ